MNKKDNINPSHYKNGSIECIDALEAATVGKTGIEAVCTANVIKYLWRYEDKNGVEDVQKALWYANKLASFLSEQENKKKEEKYKGHVEPTSWTKEGSSVPITLIGTYVRDGRKTDVFYVDADYNEGDPVTSLSCEDNIIYKYKDGADNRGRIEVYREIKDKITHIHYYINRPKQQGDMLRSAVGTGVKPTEIHHYTYKSS